jgi:hypothetical protein
MEPRLFPSTFTPRRIPPLSLRDAQGENDEATLEELRNIIISITNGDIPKPYDLSSMDAEQPEAASKTVMFLSRWR